MIRTLPNPKRLFKKLARCQSAKQEACHSDVDDGFTRVSQSFVVLAQAAIGVAPGKGAFDHPTPGQNLEPLLPFGWQDRFNAETKVSCDLIQQLTAIRAIGPEFA